VKVLSDIPLLINREILVDQFQVRSVLIHFLNDEPHSSITTVFVKGTSSPLPITKIGLCPLILCSLSSHPTSPESRLTWRVVFRSAVPVAELAVTSVTWSLVVNCHGSIVTSVQSRIALLWKAKLIEL
jgi:hypothetical protein